MDQTLKKLKSDAFNCFGVAEESVLQLFPHKTDIVLKKVAWGGSKVEPIARCAIFGSDIGLAVTGPSVFCRGCSHPRR